MIDSEIIEEKRSLAQDSRKELESKLSLEQLLSLRQLEAYGWSLQFIRKPLFQDPVPIVKEGNGQTIGILEEDGRLNFEVDLEIRKEI